MCQSARILPIRVKEVTAEENQRAFISSASAFSTAKNVELLDRSRDSIRAHFYSSEKAYLKRAPGTGGSRDRMGLNFPEASSDQPSSLGSSCSGVGIGACC